MALTQLKFKEGDIVKFRGMARNVKIIKIITDLEEVQWVRNRPHFIVIMLPTQEEIVASPHQLRSKRK